MPVSSLQLQCTLLPSESNKLNKLIENLALNKRLIIWNNIPLTVRESLTITNFKRKLKSYFSESLKESNSA